MPIGTFTRKIRRQAPPVRSPLMISPPTRGPVIVAMPMIAPTSPKTWPRSRGGKATWMTEYTWGYMSAAMNPWTTRDRSSMTALCARPQRAEARTKLWPRARGIRGVGHAN